MKIVFYVSGMPFNGDTIKNNKSLGGSESAGYYIAKEMGGLGNDVVVFSNIQSESAGQYEGVLYLPIGELSNQQPLGNNFTQFAQSVPHDVLIIQRVPNAFLNHFKSKINLWWSHDLALVRNRPNVQAQLSNIDKVLAVSEWHKKQMQDIYKIQDRCIDVLPNGIDHSHYGKQDEIDIDKKFNSKTLIFSSRPERGLENLVKPGGIMHELWGLDKEIKLFVTCYSHVSPDIKNFYDYLWYRCKELPNVTLLGFFGKHDLAKLEENSTFYVYPTDFEDTSCITAMNSQKAGTPFIASKYGALPETLNEAGVVWVDKNKDNQIDCDKYAEVIFNSLRPESLGNYHDLVTTCFSKSFAYSWEKSAKKLEAIIINYFKECTENKATLARHFVENSDIVACEKIKNDIPEMWEGLRAMFPQLDTDKYRNVYDAIASYNTDEIKNTHRIGDDSYQLSMPRMKPIIDFLEKLPEGSSVLDYGCCVGQHTIAWARKYPDLTFIGVDIAYQQIDIADIYRKENKIDNLRFYTKECFDKFHVYYDAVICSEVLEHVIDPVSHIEMLQSKLKDDDSKIILSVPNGPWEKVRWDEQTRREHLHHFETDDIEDLVGSFKNYFIRNVPHDRDLGTFVFGWDNDKNNKIGSIDYDRKLKIQNPKQTLSACIITSNVPGAIDETLKSISSITNEIIVSVDAPGGDIDACLELVLKKYNCEYFAGESPIDVGFDEVRNKTVDKAKSDWVLWIDSDEVLMWPERLKYYLRKNNFDAYAVPQHHFSAEPAGKIKTDIPCRVFRNKIGIRFFGVVHEHPEYEINSGIENTLILPETHVAIMHHGYSTEDVRRKRFKRNIPLMIKDRKKYPNRSLGKFLWIRDLCHINRFELEQGAPVSPEMYGRAKEALSIWRDFIKEGKQRFCVDSLEYISEFSRMLTGERAIEYSFSVGVNSIGIGDNLKQSPHLIHGFLETKKDISDFSSLLVSEKLKYIPDKYL